MDIKDLKHAEELLIDRTRDDQIAAKIGKMIDEWNLDQLNESFHREVTKLKKLYVQLCEDLFDKNDEVDTTPLHWVVFNKIHDMFMPPLKGFHREQDHDFFEKCQSLCKINVSAEQLGADENHAIPLCAAIVELSVLDRYKSPIEKMNCLCATYDLVFAELKTAIVSVISKSPERDNEIPVLNNDDVIPLLMLVIIKSKLVYLHTNMYYTKYFYHNFAGNREIHNIYTAFETAVDRLSRVDEDTLKPSCDKIKQSMEVVEFMKMMSSTEEKPEENKTLVDEERERILNLITRSTSEDQIV